MQNFYKIPDLICGMKLLIVEDDPDLLKSLKDYASVEGYFCDTAVDLKNALEKIALFEYDCIILDINLPDGTGFEVLQKLHQIDKSDGVIILSARDSLEDKIHGLKLGADDYLTKPFFFSELHARVKAIIRRKQYKTGRYLYFSNLTIDPDVHGVSVEGSKIPISLTKKEFAILAYLINNQKRVVSKVSLAEYIWSDYVDESQSFDFLFSQLRNLKRKLKEAGAMVEVINIYGVGYQIKAL